MMQLALVGLALAFTSRAVYITNPISRNVNGTFVEATETLLKDKKSCCVVIEQFLPNKVLYPGDPLYTASLESYYTQQEEEIVPRCIVTPESAQDVATSVLVLTTGDKLESDGCDFAVRSGGHTPWAGAANIDDGVTFDLHMLNQVEVSADRKIASIGPGNRWSNIYPKLDAEGLAMVGGRDSTVGVGGLVLGGGISYFSARKGFSCDNVENFEIVLANGQIANANQTSNQDLYRALKGGSNNFGIITRMDVALFDQGDLWGGTLVLDIANQDKINAFFEDFAKSENYDEYAALIATYTFLNSTSPWIASENVQYTKPESYPAVYKGLTDLPATVNTLRIAPLSNMTDELAVATEPHRGLRYYSGTFTFINSAAYMKEIFNLVDEWKQSVIDISGIFGAVSFQPIPAIITSKSASRGGNVLGLDGAPDIVNVLFEVSWLEASDDDRINAGVKELFAKGEAKAKEMGLFHPYIYLNYAISWERPIQSYGEANVVFLREVSKKYDSAGLFQRRCPGGFKLDE